MRSEYEYRGAGPLRDLAGKKNSMWFPSGCTMKLGFTLTLVSNVCVKSSNHRLTIRLSTNIAKSNVERCVTIAFAQGKKRNGKQAHRSSHKQLHKDASSKEQMKKLFPIVH
jgi:hypothetical protein